MSTISYINISMQVWDCVISIVVMICLLVGGSLKTKSNGLYYKVLVFNILVMFSDALAMIFRGEITDTAIVIVRVGNLVAYSSNYLLLFNFIKYITFYIDEKREICKRPLNFAAYLCFGSIILVIINQFTPLIYEIDSNNVYHRGNLFWLSQATGIVCMLICLYIIVKNRDVLSKQEKLGFLAYIILPVIALITQMFFYGLALLNMANTLGLIIIFLFLQAHQGRIIAEQEIAHVQDRVDIMLSQIQPHFLYNSLNSIYHKY